MGVVVWDATLIRTMYNLEVALDKGSYVKSPNVCMFLSVLLLTVGLLPL